MDYSALALALIACSPFARAATRAMLHDGTSPPIPETPLTRTLFVTVTMLVTAVVAAARASMVASTPVLVAMDRSVVATGNVLVDAIIMFVWASETADWLRDVRHYENDAATRETICTKIRACFRREPTPRPRPRSRSRSPSPVRAPPRATTPGRAVYGRSSAVHQQ
jgi:hypothetical protein